MLLDNEPGRWYWPTIRLILFPLGQALEHDVANKFRYRPSKHYTHVVASVQILQLLMQFMHILEELNCPTIKLLEPDGHVGTQLELSDNNTYEF